MQSTNTLAEAIEAKNLKSGYYLIGQDWVRCKAVATSIDRLRLVIEQHSDNLPAGGRPIKLNFGPNGIECNGELISTASCNDWQPKLAEFVAALPHARAWDSLYAWLCRTSKDSIRRRSQLDEEMNRSAATST